MASISDLSGAYAASQTTTNTGKSDMGKEEFLLLLTTQLKHQDPMNPMDNSEFVAQLSQFSSLEQLWNINDTMGAGNDLTLALNNTMMTSLIGKEVHFASDTLYQSDEGVSADIGFYLSNSGLVTVDITNEDGQVIRTLSEGVLDAGDQRISWDGLDEAGNAVANGQYTVQVEYQTDGGAETQLNPYMIGHVSGIQVAEGQPWLFIGDQPVNPALILSIYEANNS
ncbi:flagellar hook capping protein [bacterium]|nr:flagellar hook capping protein [bacterium]